MNLYRRNHRRDLILTIGLLLQKHRLISPEHEPNRRHEGLWLSLDIAPGF